MKTGSPPTLSVPQAARILGISRNHAYVAVRRGEIPSVRIGNRIVVPTHRLIEMLNGGRAQARSVGGPDAAVRLARAIAGMKKAAK